MKRRLLLIVVVAALGGCATRERSANPNYGSIRAEKYHDHRD